MRRLRQLRAAGDGGFTLVELLITIVILGIIAVPLTSVVITFFLNSSDTTARLSESHDAQITNAYWQQDVASLGLRGEYDQSQSTYPLQTSVDTTSTSLLACSANLPSGSLVVAMAWNQYSISGQATQVGVAYLTQPDGARSALVRAHCTGSSVDSTATMAHYVTGTPSVSCPGLGSCDNSSPSTMSLSMTVSDPTGKNPPLAVTFTGQRRQT